MITPICKCGHLKRDHNGFFDTNKNHYKTGCNFYKHEIGNCICWEFLQDNLKTLEYKYETSFR